MTWYIGGAAVIGFMLAVNFIVSLLRAMLTPGNRRGSGQGSTFVTEGARREP
jgi:hypothetical protein